ncbi:hypothetical protein MAPG_11132 [Magnaporthiopsis poae ATCC 64411]|uniref:Uncharacterized protein n=1 Tax=Magnaporthiopsis poae (strain ATCC 64411 / 73-15) TaxID=644358 RepID=A0A0C4EEF9_MAGP6|nr:hypothetical protein MAPG_11132 [Magnaporthiopsis poae ATCC 64411]
MWRSRLLSAGAGGGGMLSQAMEWYRFLVSSTQILVRICLSPFVYLLEQRRRNRSVPGRQFPTWGPIRCIINIFLKGGVWGPRPTTRRSGKGSYGLIAAPMSTPADATSDHAPIPEDPWVTAHEINAINSPLYRVPEEVLLHVMESLDAPALYWSGGGGGSSGSSGGGIRGGGFSSAGASSVLMGGRAAWGCAAEPPWQQHLVTARDLIGQALRRDLLCASCRDVRSGWERPLGRDQRDPARPALRRLQPVGPQGTATTQRCSSSGADACRAAPPAGGRMCRGREGRIRLCEHVTIGWDQVESEARSAARERRREDRRVTLRCMHKSHDFGGRVAEEELESKENKDGEGEGWENKTEYQRLRWKSLGEDTSRVWGEYPEVIVEPPPRGSAFGWKADPTAREEKDAVASVLVRRTSAPFYFKSRPASVEELLRMLREMGVHETITTCPHVTFDEVVRRSFDPNVCACIGRGKVQVHHQHKEPNAGCCMCHYIQTCGKESIFCDTMDLYLPWGPDQSDDDEASATTTPWYHQRPSRARHRPTRHGTSCNECLSEYWWISNPRMSRILRLVSTTPDWGVDGPLDPRWLRLVDPSRRDDGQGKDEGNDDKEDAEERDPLACNLLWCPNDSGNGRQCAVARRGRTWGHGLERTRNGIFELGYVYLNTGAIGAFFATLIYGGNDRWESPSAVARNRPIRGRGGVGFLSQEMILGSM